MPRRGNTTDRGYGSTHQRLRAEWAPFVDAGDVDCWRCRLPIDPVEPWDLGHDDDDRTIYRGPEHVTCNRSTAARRGNLMRAGMLRRRRRVLRRSWDV